MFVKPAKLPIAIISFFLILHLPGFAERPLAQYPGFLSNAYIGAGIGYIHYPFTNQHLKPGYEAQSITIPHTAIRLTIYGKHINEYLAFQVNLMRPVEWVVYHQVGGELRKSVWMNYGNLTLLPRLPINDKFSFISELGMTLVSRNGFLAGGKVTVEDANYMSFIGGGGLYYHVNRTFDLSLQAVFIPGSKSYNQPYTMFITPAFRYHLRPLSDEQLQQKLSYGYHFPEHQVLISYTTNVLGYDVNNFLSEGKVPVFWGGDVEVDRGLSINYQKSIYHGRKIFSLDLGGNVAYFETRNYRTSFFAVSLYPLARFTLIRSQPADFFFFFSLAGPTYLNKWHIDGVDTGKNFTFSDYLGIGFFAGPSRSLMTEIKIGHYSNGNMFPQNPGIKIPLTFSVGFTF